MTTGFDPGVLGVYGFHNRRSRAYGDERIATALDVSRPRIWERLGEAGLRSVVVGVPQTFPPKPIHGTILSGILTPDLNAPFAQPDEAGRDVVRAVGDYILDVHDYRARRGRDLEEELHRFMNNRFDAMEYLLQRDPWDFAMMVEMATDRLHHAFWPAAPGDDRFVLRRFYEALDARVGRLCTSLPADTTVLVVSDHGAQACAGGFCLNQWLAEEGDLVFREPPDRVQPFSHEHVDWRRTKAWASGGYAGRVHFNVCGREPEGALAAGDIEQYRRDLAERLHLVSYPGGGAVNEVLEPESAYAEVNGIAPGLLVYPGGLAWRAVGTVGHDAVFVGRDTPGLDLANHAMEGIFIGQGPGFGASGARAPVSILDVAPTVLAQFGLTLDTGMTGTPLTRVC